MLFTIKHWLKRPKANSPKMKTGPKYEWFKISYLEFVFFENIRAYSVFIFLQTFQLTSSEFFFLNFRFSSRKSQSQQKLAKKITRFTIQFRSTILRTSTHLTLKIISSLSHFTNFPADMFLFGVRKNIWTAPILDAQ